MYGVDGGGTRASGPTCTRRAFQVRPHSTAASKLVPDERDFTIQPKLPS